MPALTRRKVLTGAVAVIATMGSFPHLLWAVSKKKRKTRTNTIRIEKLKFSPPVLEAAVGDTITWVNCDVVPHTATALDKSWDTGLLKKRRHENDQSNRKHIFRIFL
tara:strand:- start:528 stop:848 length:321 start_codon:yes stop_codon:yes gene_type:complete